MLNQLKLPIVNAVVVVVVAMVTIKVIMTQIGVIFSIRYFCLVSRLLM